MFEDFVRKKDRERALRWAASLGCALLLLAAIAAVAVAATNRPPEPEEEEEVVVEFAPPPEPEEVEPEAEPIPVEEPVVAPRPRVVRTEIVVPTEIDQDLEESDRELTDEGPSGPETGRTGRAGSRGTIEPPPPPPPPPPPRPRPGGPVQLPENATPAERIGPLPPLDYPRRAQEEGIQGLVIVKCAIALSGEPVRCSVLRGVNELNASALAWVQEQRFVPAHLPDGTQIVQWKIFPVRFRLTNLP